jgi:hypothetical protein
LVEPPDLGLKKAPIEILQFDIAPQSALTTLCADILVHTDLVEKCLYQTVMDLASSYGHEWFSWRVFKAIPKNNGAAFVVSTFKLWLGKHANSEVQKLRDLIKARLFKEFGSLVGGYYDSFFVFACKYTLLGRSVMLAVLAKSTHCRRFAKLSSLRFLIRKSSCTTILLSQRSQLSLGREPPLHFLLFRAQNVWKLWVFETVPPSTPVPVNIPRQSDVPPRKTHRATAPLSPL